MTVSQTHANGNGHASEHRPLVPGVYVPTVAFFSTVHEEVDIFTVAKHASRLATSGIAGLVTHGSNGEAVHLTHIERSVITSSTRKALDKAGALSMPIIVGCGTQSVKETVVLCTEAKESGGDYAIVLPPSYYASLLNPQLILDFFTQVADASPIPIIIYNYPAAQGGFDLSSDDILTLSAHHNIVGVKLTCGNTGKLARIVASVKPSFLTLGGSADFTLQTMVVGGHGVIAGLANLAPKACVKIMRLFEEGKLKEARELQAIVARGDWVAIKGGFVSVKVGLEKYYEYGGLPRKPCALPEKKALVAMNEEFAELLELERTL
ncbi:dihydrodipicolinate synthetase family protein [Sclerotinia borealis F-4128]|uniref:Dihydrodipicolinate synthetase family protein n=1 Tax=Sclerotinia borealis (strain F-4128) TaxID=1432307 RepID=W9C2J8_SCLBF|nr:dihydrodipicolinate synthetase family protein [Sclerotinia borealis F-4128]